ncbi:phosphotransferase enzyme family protein [Halochromatium sp.]
MDDQSNVCSDGLDETAQEIARRFLPGERGLRLRPLGAGLINDTRLVETGAKRFVLQRINGAVFTDADAIAANLLRVQDWLEVQDDQADQLVRLPRLIRSASGEAILRDADGQAWRLLEHIDHSRVIKPLENLTQAAEIGGALGRFHAALAELDPHHLSLTLPGLHDTPRYKVQLDAAVQAANASEPTRAPQRANAAGIARPRPMSAEVLAALQQIESRADLIPILKQARAQGTLSLHVTHGDPKLDNLLFARDEDRALCLIDLDTVQPGLWHEDIADCLRSCCNRSGSVSRGGVSDESDDGSVRAHTDTRATSTRDTSTGDTSTGNASSWPISQARATFDLDVCRALLGGYAEYAAALFDDAAIALLYPAIQLIPLELAIRFLTDYLQGDRYFRVTSPRQNLDKTLIQLALVDDIERKRTAIEAIIHDSFKRGQSRA